MGDEDDAETTGDRIAGAPISWGVCEVPGWGHQLPPDRVLQEMAELGLTATEFGPDGFLPTAPQARAQVPAATGCRRSAASPRSCCTSRATTRCPRSRPALPAYAASGAGVMVLSAVTGLDGYDQRPHLDGAGWARLLRNLDRVAAVTEQVGVRAVLHPHVGTMVETGDDVARVLEGSAVPLCLDTGHLLIGGTDPSELARQAPDRIAHTHLKDVDATVAAKVQDGRLTYYEAVRQGMYRPLGTGDVDVAAIVGHLRRAGYEGWWVMEQDTVLDEAPTDEGPLSDVRTSAEHLRAVLRGA